MLGSISSICQSYYNEIPERTLQTIGISAIYSFTFHLLSMPVVKGRGYEVNLLRPILAASAAALASLIHALTTPIFRFIFGDNRVYFHRQLMRSLVAILATDAIFNYSTAKKINLIAFQVSPHLPVGLMQAALSDAINLVDWVNTQMIVPCFGVNRLQTSGIRIARERFATMGFLPDERSNAIYIVL